MHSHQLAAVVSRWLCPPRTTKGGLGAEGVSCALPRRPSGPFGTGSGACQVMSSPAAVSGGRR